MSATETGFVFRPDGRTSDLDTDVEMRKIRRELLQLELAIPDAAHVQPVSSFAVVVNSAASTPGATQVPNAVVFEFDEDSVVASDIAGAAIGVGADAGEALNDWLEAAMQLYRELQAEELQLHPRLHRQLKFLRKMFG